MDKSPANRGQSSDSIATSDEFEDLGQSNKLTASPSSQEENQESFKELSASGNKPSPEMEIGNNGNIADLQDTLDEALNEETQTSGILLLFRYHYIMNQSFLFR